MRGSPLVRARAAEFASRLVAAQLGAHLVGGLAGVEAGTRELGRERDAQHVVAAGGELAEHRRKAVGGDPDRAADAPLGEQLGAVTVLAHEPLVARDAVDQVGHGHEGGT